MASYSLGRASLSSINAFDGCRHSLHPLRTSTPSLSASHGDHNISRLIGMVADNTCSGYQPTKTTCTTPAVPCSCPLKGSAPKCCRKPKGILQGCVRYGTGTPGTGMDRAQLTKMSITGIDVVPNLPKCPVPVLMSYRTYRSVRYRWWRCTEPTEVSGTGMKVCTSTGGTGTHIVPKLSSVYYWHGCRTELNEVSDTGIDVVPNLRRW